MSRDGGGGTQAIQTQSYGAAAVDVRPDKSLSSPEAEGSSWRYAALNITNTVLCGGISVVALPLCAQESGLVAYGIVTCLTAVMSAYTADLLVITASKVQAHTYSRILEFALGKTWAWVVDLFIFVFWLGCCVTFLQAFASVAPLNLPGESHFWVVFVGLVDLIVLLLMTRLDQLAPLSCAAIIPLIFFGGLTVYYGLQKHAGHDASGRNVNIWPESLGGILRTLPIIVFAFSYQPNAMPIYSDLCKPKGMNWILAVASATAFSVAVCIFFGFMGALQHPDTQGNILVDFGHTSLGAFAGFAISVAMVASIPLLAWEATHSMCNLVLVAKGLEGSADSGKEDSESLVDENRSTGCSPSKLGLCIFMTMCTGIALFVEDISKVIGLTGAVCGVPLVLTFPPAAYLAVSSEENTFQKCLALLTLMSSMVLWILCTYYTVIA